MSIIAIDGIPLKANLKGIVKDLARPIHGHFEALNFDPILKHKGAFRYKTCYIRISERLDPVGVVEKINNYNFKGHKYHAFVPNNVPDLPLKRNVVTKKKAKGKLPVKLRMALGISDEGMPPEEVINLSTHEILCELIAKYTGLYDLSKKIGHKLLQELSKKIFSRVKAIVDSSPEIGETCFKTTRAYRRGHPHFGDFQLVLDTLHAIQDEAGTPRTELQERELEALAGAAHTLDMPIDKIRSLCAKYTAKITEKMIEYMKNLDSDIGPADTEEQIARKQVREELKKLNPYLNEIVGQVVNKHFIRTDKRFYNIRIYGEPFLPNKETMSPFLARYKPRHVLRSTRMYNMLRFSVPPALYHSLMAMNGTVLNGAKLIIRQSDIAQYKALRRAVRGAYDGCEADDGEDEAMDEDQNEKWDEDGLEL